MLEQYLFIGLLIGGLFGLILTFTRRHKKTFPVELAIAVVLLVAGAFGPTLFNFPPTPFVLFPSLSYGSDDAAESIAAVSNPASRSDAISSSSSEVSSKGSVVVKDSSTGAVVSEADVAVVDEEAKVQILVKTDSKGIVPVAAALTQLDSKITSSGKPTPNPSNDRDLKIKASTSSRSKETTVKVLGFGQPAPSSIELSVDVLPPLSSAFVTSSGGVQSVSAQSSFVSGSPVFVPIAPSETFSANSLTGSSLGLEFKREVRITKTIIQGREVTLSTISLIVINRGDEEIQNLVIEENLRDIFNNPDRPGRPLTDEEKIELVGVSEAPIELKSGEFARWLFASIEPNEEAQVSYTVKGSVDEEAVQKLPAPVAVAVSNEPLKVIVKQQSSFDTTAVIGLILASAIVCAIAVFFVRRP